ncbi:MAG TPA: 3'-5' exonuclease, partial [Patescibacteria group bacterium]|nr:3'-5' exonuclease [Patescibacteria group bacterium]
ERFAKRIAARPGAVGRIVLAPDGADDDDRVRHVLAAWTAAGDPDGSTQAILARTNRELLPAAAVALEAGIPFRAERLDLPLDDPRLDAILADLASDDPGEAPLLRLGRLRNRLAAPRSTQSTLDPTASGPGDRGLDVNRLDATAHGSPEPIPVGDLVAAVLAWAAGYRDVASFVAAVHDRRSRLEALRRADASLTLATAHSTKGLEFDHVAVIDMDDGRFPSQRSLDDADDPARAMEEERRLGYVAWTRARRSLTLVYDPAAPSVFLREAFTADELGLSD